MRSCTRFELLSIRAVQAQADGGREPLILFRQGVRLVRAAMRAQLYEKSTQREAWRRIRHSPGRNLTGASLSFGIDTRAPGQFPGNQWADCVSLSQTPFLDGAPIPDKISNSRPELCDEVRLL